MKRIIKLVLLLIWMSIIFYFSNQKGIDSSQTSSFATKIIYSVISIFIGKDTINETNFIIEYMPIIRKLAHFSEYMILGLLAYLNIIEYSKTKLILKSFIFSFLFSTSDEIHQYFIENRHCSFKDVLIDSSGAIIGILVCYMLLRICKKH